MPYRWEQTEGAPDQAGAPLHAGPLSEVRLILWPHRSLSAKGFVAFITATALLTAVPVIALVGTLALWIILIFSGTALAIIWLALQASARALNITEHLSLSEDRILLTRHEGAGRRLGWEDNPHWVRVTLYPTAGPVPFYLTLSGKGREVELGRFLTPDERKALAIELRAALAAVRQPAPATS